MHAQTVATNPSSSPLNRPVCEVTYLSHSFPCSLSVPSNCGSFLAVVGKTDNNDVIINILDWNQGIVMETIKLEGIFFMQVGITHTECV